jgi:predicted enzyme related to lactoylglutathione lyase
MKIATVAVYVENQEEALSFWTEKVGFVLHRSQSMGPNARWLEVGPEGAESCLVIYPKSMMEDWAERKPSVVFECGDIQEKYQEMSSRGVTFTEPPKQMHWGPFAMFLDTEGNWFGLRQKTE